MEKPGGDNDVNWKELGFPPVLVNNIKKLHITWRWAKSVIDDAERILNLYQGSRQWLLKLKDATSDADHLFLLTGRRKVSEVPQIHVFYNKMNYKVTLALERFTEIRKEAQRSHLLLPFENEIDSEVSIGREEVTTTNSEVGLDLSAASSLIEKLIGKLDNNIWEEELRSSSHLINNIQKLRRFLFMVMDTMRVAHMETEFERKLIRNLNNTASTVYCVVDKLQIEAQRRELAGRKQSNTWIIRKVHQLMLSPQTFVFHVKMTRKIKFILNRVDYVLERSIIFERMSIRRSEIESTIESDMPNHDPPVVSPLLNWLIKKLVVIGNSDNRQFRSDLAIYVIKLQEILSLLNRMMDDVESITNLDMQKRKWLLDIKDATFDLDDVIDELQIEAQLQRLAGNKQFMKMIFRKERLFSPHAFSFKMAGKIKELLQRFHEIAAEYGNLRLRMKNVSRCYAEPETGPHVIENRGIVGREADIEKVIDILINTQNEEDLSVLPIVGFAGVGKTTLAQLVLADERIQEHFDLCKWLYLGQDWNIYELAKSMIRCTIDEICSSWNLENIHHLLQEKLQGRRFLLVLDNMKIVHDTKWEELKSWFIGGKLGSKIIVTTDSIYASHITYAVPTPYWLQTLSEEDCWLIVKNWEFEGQKFDNPKSAAIEGEIARRCGGLPLAANLLARILHNKREEELVEIKNCNLWTFCEGTFPTLTPVALSYYFLPIHLRQCFSYCSVFPLSYRIDRLKLLQIWMAEELIHSVGHGMHIEDVGHQYFNDFLLSHFFEYEEKDELGNVASCRINVLMHELVRHLARDGLHADIGVNQVIYHGGRYSSLIVDEELPPSFENSYNEMKKLRSLFVFAQKQCLAQYRSKTFLNFISSLTSLRVLHLSNVGIRNFPSSMRRLKHLRFLDLSKNLITEPNSINILGKLKQLRFLDLSENMITSLPDSITTLYNLEILNLVHCTELQELPKGLTNISSLRHLDISECEGLTCMPNGLEGLRSLRALPLFIVSSEPGYRIVELQQLNQIRGQLRIEGLQNVQDPVEAMEAKLGHKQELQSLELCWNRAGEESQLSREDEDTATLESLQPYPNLKRLRIENYNWYRFPDWLTKIDPSSLFSNLEVLSLHSLKRCKSFPNLSQMPSLKRLDINRMDAITEGKEFYGSGGTFPSLKFLSLCNLPNLKEWFVPEIDKFPSLESLEISWCPELSPSFLPPSLVKLTLMSNKEEFLAAEGGMQGLSKLKKLIVIGFDTSKSRLEGLQHLAALQELTISCCPQLTCLPPVIMQQKFPFLQTLVLEFNTNLKSLGGEGENPPLFFTELQYLTIVDCSALTALPEWLGGLKSFKSLKLKCCNKLSTLPYGLKHVKTLWRLSIDFCPILAKRCKEGGLDWHKISHIPNVNISST